MDIEYVDIVNEKNEVIGKTSKQESHEKGLLHRTVVVELIGSDGKWTLVKQAPDRQDAGQFVSPVGGHVSSGESEDSAMRRETKEELGITVTDNFKLIGRSIFNRHVCGRQENHFFVLYQVYSDDQPVLNHEAVGYERFSPEELKTELKENPGKFGDAFHFLVREFYPELI